MPESDIGNFKVVIQGEVDPKIEQKLEGAIEKGAKRGAQKFEQEFARKLETLIRSPSYTNFLNFVGRAKEKIGASVGVSKTETSKSTDVGASMAEGAEAGSAAGPKGAIIGALAGLIAKISIGVTAISLVVKALDGLAPLQAMMKMMVAILQITLYPIAQFFLSIFKPIIVMLLQYLILPFYYNVMPALIKVGEFIGNLAVAFITGDCRYWKLGHDHVS